MGNAHRVDLNCMFARKMLVIDRVALAKQRDDRIGGVRPSVCLSFCPSVCPSVNALTAKPFDL